ncbi:unnamed protein product [Lymnaea stagnalis]|uniref:G-protein coupled receptors family 1 profile domain-containing protein n=1 Tax=Lymnaea stagnalis TaxID=6523 RepID=A0AAV2H1B0_LYMST
MNHTVVQSGIASAAARDAYGVALSVASGIICSFGTVANVVNIIVFVRQGLTDTVTITLLALSFMDFGVTITMLGVGMCFSPLVINAGYPVNLSDLSYIIGWTHIAFSRVSSGMTAFVSFERCLCIAMPLKVRTIITNRRTCVVMVVITVIMTLSTAPVFYTSRMAWNRVPDSNRTILSMVFTDDRDLVDNISFGINTVFLIPVIFVATIIFTIILAINLNRKAKWRDSVTTGKNEEKTDKSTVSNKDRRAIKMVAIISVVYIFCYAPDIMTVFTAIIVSEFNFGRREENLLLITGTFTLLLQSVNSSVNIFIYLKMSSKFKRTFDAIFLSCLRLKST